MPASRPIAHAAPAKPAPNLANIRTLTLRAQPAAQSGFTAAQMAELTAYANAVQAPSAAAAQQPASNDSTGQYDPGYDDSQPADAPTIDDGSTAPTDDGSSDGTSTAAPAQFWAPMPTRTPGPGLPPPVDTSLSTPPATAAAPAATLPATPPAATVAPPSATKREMIGAGAGAAAGFLFLGPIGAGIGALVGGAGAWLTRPKSPAPVASAMSGESGAPTTKYLTVRTSDLIVRPASYYKFVPKPVLDVFASWCAKTRAGTKRFGRWEAHVSNGTVVIYGPPFGEVRS